MIKCTLLLLFIGASLSLIAQDDTTSVEDNSIHDVVLTNRDTLQINGSTYYLTAISEEKFNENQPRPSMGEGTFNDRKNVMNEPPHLVFSLENGQDTMFIDDYTEGWSNYVDYSLGFSYQEIHYWLVDLGLYEGGAHFLLSKLDGERTWVFSAPIFSPDGNHFICYAFDIEAGYVINGIQLFKTSGSEVQLVWEKEIFEWGPHKIVWHDNATILIKQTELDFDNDDYPYKHNFCSMKVISNE